MAVPTLPLKPGQVELVSSIVARLKEGNVGDFIRPWKDIIAAPRNGISGRQYAGYNRFITTFIGFMRNFSSPLWLTEKQIAERGGRILPDQIKKSIPIIYTGRYSFKVSDGSKTESHDEQKALQFDGTTPVPEWERTPKANPPLSSEPTKGAGGPAIGPVYSTGYFIKEFYVWNLQQTSGVRLPKKIEALLADQATARFSETPDAGLERLRSSLLKADIAPIFLDRMFDCYYDIGRHQIHAPKEGCFNSELDKWEAIAHETIHATGARHLLNRPTIVELRSMQSQEYALEEITAVIGSMFLCQDCSVPVTPERERNFAAYLSSYDAINILDKNPSLFVRALVFADFAAQFTLHPENRPQFIRDRAAPNQIEFTFDEFSHGQHAVFPDEVVMPEAEAAAKAMDAVAGCSVEQPAPAV
jgi:antirestriction protein ArdC